MTPTTIAALCAVGILNIPKAERFGSSVRAVFTGRIRIVQLWKTKSSPCATAVTCNL